MTDADAMLCNHANECPGRCPCDDACYCRQPGNTCGTADAARTDRNTAEARMTALVDVLERIEWEGATDHLACPCCKRPRCSTGHASDCALAACLRGAR